MVNDTKRHNKKSIDMRQNQFYLFVAPEDHHIGSEKMARTDAIEELRYHHRAD